MWHDSYVLVVLAFAAVAVIAGVTVVAMGRGGELSEFAPDVPPLNLPQAGQLGAVDFMALQLPVSLVGYNTQSVDETLNRVAGALSERDTRIAVLEQRVSELLAGRLQARHELNPGSPSPQRGLEAPYELLGGGGFGASEELSNGSPAFSHAEREKALPGLSGESGSGASEELSGGSAAGREPEVPGEPSGPEKPSKAAEAAEATGTAEAATPSGVSPFARPSEPSALSEPSASSESSKPSEASEASSVPDSPSSSSPARTPGSKGLKDLKDPKDSKASEASPGSVGLRTGERQETEGSR
ncbi:hypothetical protein [Streptosporangium sp. V21-05]|uniref:hypothetical protein n=1 Tax=Streptosporangium sp. V21-05 TaxID=3446115 RepID=UPI003F53CB73